MSRGGRKTHAHDDQYGEVGRGDDGDARDDGARSTGGAGARKGAKGSVAYVRRLPKFLEAHAGLLGATTTTRDDDDARATVNDAVDARTEAVRGETDAVRGETDARARTGAAPRRSALSALGFDDDESIAEMAAVHKGEGNRAFQEKRFEDAVASFSRAAALEPKNWVFFSNRSAAYAELGRYDDALDDAKETIRLNCEWTKGYVRLATACSALGRLSEATAAWRRACELDDENASLRESLAKAEAAEESSLKEGKFKFQGSKRKETAGDGEDVAGGDVTEAKKKKKKPPPATLSFADDDG
jgi:stress-induced-phosphoprotein 1